MEENEIKPLDNQVEAPREEARPVEEKPKPAPKPSKKSAQRKKAENTAKAFSWADIKKIISFKEWYDKDLASETKSFIKKNFEVSSSKPLDIAQALHEFNADRYKAIKRYMELVLRLHPEDNQSIGMSKLISIGIETTTWVSEMDRKSITTVFNTIHTLMPEFNGGEEIAYNARMSDEEIAQVIVDSAAEYPQDKVWVLKQVRELLSIWPEQD